MLYVRLGKRRQVGRGTEYVISIVVSKPTMVIHLGR